MMLVRATVAFALAFGLAKGTSAEAAPPAGGVVENPFGPGGDDAADKGDKGDDKSAAPAQPSPPPAASTSPAGTPLPESGPPSGEPADRGEDQDQQGQQEQEDNGDANTSEPGDADNQGEDQPESALHGLTCLEGDSTGAGRRKGVQRRDFMKRHRFELSGVGGFYASDALSSTYSYGGALSFYPSEDFGVEVLLTRSPVQFRLEEPFNSFDHQEHFVPGMAWQGIVSLLWSPIHAKFKFTDQTIIHGDIFVVLGAGRTFDASVQGITAEEGLGLKLYLAHYVTFRLDLRDFLIPQEVLGRGRITNNVSVMAGFSLWLPG